jgi:hypothetical protein
VLKLVESALDKISRGAEMAADDELDLAVAFGWDDGGDASDFEVVQDDVGTVALDVGDLAAG